MRKIKVIRNHKGHFWDADAGQFREWLFATKYEINQDIDADLKKAVDDNNACEVVEFNIYSK